MIKCSAVVLGSLAIVVGGGWTQAPEPTPSAEVFSASGGAVIWDVTPTATPAWPTANDGIEDRVDQNAVIDEFKADQGELDTVIRTGGLAEAWIRSGSNLFTWANYPDYLGMLERLQDLYAHLDGEEIADAYDIRRGILTNDLPDCFACMDAGLMAMAVGRSADAEECFRLAADASFYQGNPIPRVLTARALLARGLLGPATAEYEAAIAMVEAASGDSGLLFRLRYAKASDLFDQGYVELSLRQVNESLQSEYWVERLWAVTRLVSYHWCKNERQSAEELANELETLLELAQASPDVLWEHRRVRHAEKALERIRGAQSGDPVKEMIMDEESLEWEWQAGNYQVIADRLQPWIDRYPISQYAQWDPEVQEWASWVHWTYSISLTNLGRLDEGEAGLRAIIENVPVEHSRLRHVNAWCWLGHCLGLQKRYAEGVEAYETGLGLDVAHIDPEKTGTPVGFDQPRVRGGTVNGDWRPGYVAMYKQLLKWRALGPEFERLEREEDQ